MTELPWIGEARKHIGLKEVPGEKSNPTIVQWLKEMGGFPGAAKSWYFEDGTSWCLTGDTEVLTSEGFVRLDEISKIRPKFVAQVDQETLGVSYTDTYGYIEKPYSGTIYEFKRSGLMCDPEHRIFAKFTGAGKNKLRPASSITKAGAGIPRIHSTAPGANCTDEELVFLAAFLSDGTYTGKKGYVKFGFSKQRKMDIIERFPYSSKKTEKVVYGASVSPITRYKFDRSLLREDFLSDYKLLSWDFLFSLSEHQAKVFILAYAQFDGTPTQGGGNEVFTADPALQEQLTFIATMAGFKTTPYRVKQVSKNSKIEYLYHVYISANNRRNLSLKQREELDFNGKLYCLTVPTSVMVIRTKKGVIMPIGNCGLFVGHCLGKGGRAVIKDWYRAKAWAAGGLTKLDAPAYGCLAVKSRQGGGHVFFVVGKDAKGRILGLGGNQSDMVSIVPFDPALIEGYYWPSKLVDGKPVASYPTEERYNLPDAKITAKQGSSES